MITSLGQLRWISYCANTAYFMSVKIGTTPETPKSRLSCVVPIIYHSHALNDAAGGGEQGGVGDAEEQVAGGLVRAVEADELHTVLPHIAAGDGGEDGGGAGGDLAGSGHGDRRAAGEEVRVGHGAENAAAAVDGDGAHIALDGEVALELAGIALGTLFHRFDGGLHDGAGGQRHELGGIHVGDAVAEGTVLTGGGVVVGQGADAGHAVTYPGTQLPDTVIFAGTGGEGQSVCAAADGEDNGRAGRIGQKVLDLLGGADSGAVHGGDDIALTKAAGAGGRGAIGQSHHQNAVRKEFDAHRLTQGDHGALRRGGPSLLHAEGEGKQRREQPGGETMGGGDMPWFIQASHPLFYCDVSRFCR